MSFLSFLRRTPVASNQSLGANPLDHRVIQAEARVWAKDLEPLAKAEQTMARSGEWDGKAVQAALDDVDIDELRSFLLLIGGDA